MGDCDDDKHTSHGHEHSDDCGHTAIRHGDHVDYLHEGHLHHPDGEHVDEHALEVNAENPAGTARRRTTARTTRPDTSTGRTAATRRCRMATTSTTWSATTSTTRTATTATTTAR